MAWNANNQNAELLVVDPKAQYRSSLRYTLNALDFSDVQFGSKLGDINQALDKRLPDLVITDCNLPDGDVCSLIKTIRGNQNCPNPFLSIIVITWDPTKELVQKIINSGADDILVQPISTSHMHDRIDILTYNRKPFVVTARYIGPDRRHKARPGGQDVPLIEVPNTLRAKITGTMNPSQMRQAIRSTINRINKEKLKRNADHIPFMAEKIHSGFLENSDVGVIQRDLDELASTTKDFLARAKDTRYEHFSDLCRAMVMVTSKLKDAPANPAERNLEIMVELSKAIKIAFEDGAD